MEVQQQGNREQVITELRRVAVKLNRKTLTKKEFLAHSNLGPQTPEYAFGSWNRAVHAAGLEPITRPVLIPKKISDEELMSEIIELTKKLGKPPSDREMMAFGKYSTRPYVARWGSFARGREAAYQKIGCPEASRAGVLIVPRISSIRPATFSRATNPVDHLKPRRRVRFGEPINFRGLRHAPINEQGVVYLFGMVSKELGFVIESIRTEFPDCEGKRCVDKRENLWEQILIEFEYRSSHFREHGHSLDGCDLIICWIHDWVDCPVDVLELKSTIQRLPESH